jgi:hypothetical protein
MRQARKTQGKGNEGGREKEAPPPPEPMSLPDMSPMFFVDAGNWHAQPKHDAGFMQHYAFSADAWRVYSLRCVRLIFSLNFCLSSLA